MASALTENASDVASQSTSTAAGKSRESLASFTQDISNGVAWSTIKSESFGCGAFAASGFARYSIVAVSRPSGALTTQVARSDLSMPNTFARVPVITSRGALTPWPANNCNSSADTASVASINTLCEPETTRTPAPRRNSEIARSTSIRGSGLNKMNLHVEGLSHNFVIMPLCCKFLVDYT